LKKSGGSKEEKGQSREEKKEKKDKLSAKKIKDRHRWVYLFLYPMKYFRLMDIIWKKPRTFCIHDQHRPDWRPWAFAMVLDWTPRLYQPIQSNLWLGWSRNCTTIPLMKNIEKSKDHFRFHIKNEAHFLGEIDFLTKQKTPNLYWFQ
jgi:hypothetical protein